LLFWLLFSNSFFTNTDGNRNGHGNFVRETKSTREGTSRSSDEGTTHRRSSACSNLSSNMHKRAMLSTSCGECCVPSCLNGWGMWVRLSHQSKIRGYTLNERKNQW
jgi:hypothetical protein